MDEDYCNRCGEFGAGQMRWMFYSKSLPVQEFFCTRCLRVMRIYAWIGFSLLFTVLAVLCGAVFWLKRLP